MLAALVLVLAMSAVVAAGRKGWSSTAATSDLVMSADHPFGSARHASLVRLELRRLDLAMEGRVWFQGDPEFEEAARVWRRDQLPPAAVVEAASEKDVQLAVPVLGRLSKEYGVPFRIRSGGHNKAGFSTVHGGIVLSLKHMRSLSVDSNSSGAAGATRNADTALAWIQPGARVEDVLDELLAKEGYAGALGQCGKVAEGGWVLGGGVGFMSRLLGLGVDNVREFRIVLADGSVKVCSPDQNPDLFWALRGAGSGNFGVVTSMKYELRQVPDTQLVKMVQIRFDDLAEFLFKLGEAGASREFMLVVASRDGDAAVVYMSWFSADADVVQAGNNRFEQEIQPLLKPAAAHPGPYQDINWATSTHQVTDAGYGTEVWAAQAWQGFLFPENNTLAVWNDIVTIMNAGIEEAPNLEPHIEQWGGAISDVPPSATAFPYREAVYNVGVLLVMQDQEEDSAQRFQEQVTSVNAWWPLVAKYLTGAYVNYPMNSLSRVEYARLYWGEHLERLVEVKQRYDPDDIFSYEQSIPLNLP